MARIKPFRGLRPRGELAHKVASPPYDVLDSDEARQMAHGNPLSFLHVNKPEIDLPPSMDLYRDEVYAKGAENFKKLRDEGVFFQDPSPCLYVYQQKMGDHIQVGLVACASVEEYEQGLIKKHEHTRPDKEKDRARHIEALHAQAGPVFLTYRSSDEINKLVERVRFQDPEVDFVAPDGIAHTFFVVSQEEWIRKIVAAFGKILYLYVADGHHRSAAALRVRDAFKAKNPNHTGEEEYNFFLSVLFPHNQMKIMDYNRAVRDLHGLAPEAFLERIQENFVVEKSRKEKPRKRRTFTMIVGKEWYRLSCREGTFNEKDPVQSLDVSILQSNLLQPVLGIEDPRTDQRIHFVGGVRGLDHLERLVQEGSYQVAFVLYPTSMEELMAIADTGKVMPPKSTWFEPKLRSGLIVHLLENGSPASPRPSNSSTGAESFSTIGF